MVLDLADIAVVVEGGGGGLARADFSGVRGVRPCRLWWG